MLRNPHQILNINKHTLEKMEHFQKDWHSILTISDMAHGWYAPARFCFAPLILICLPIYFIVLKQSMGIVRKSKKV